MHIESCYINYSLIFFYFNLVMLFFIHNTKYILKIIISLFNTKQHETYRTSQIKILLVLLLTFALAKARQRQVQAQELVLLFLFLSVLLACILHPNDRQSFMISFIDCFSLKHYGFENMLRVIL